MAVMALLTQLTKPFQSFALIAALVLTAAWFPSTDALASTPSSMTATTSTIALAESSFSMVQQRAAIAVAAAGDASMAMANDDSSNPQRADQSPRKLEAPFPNGLCGGTLITIPPEETYGIDINLANNNWAGSFMLIPRPIYVWLPPDYDDDVIDDDGDGMGNRHPVLYVHDGNNAMSDVDSWTGQSWRLAGALTRMKDHGMFDTHAKLPICVLLPSPPTNDNNVDSADSVLDDDLQPQENALVSLLFAGVRRRHLEYGDMMLPFAQAHVDFVAQTVKPLIDNRYRTKPQREHTHVMGTSMGGQASLHCVLRYPELFGGAACLSPCFQPSILQAVLSQPQRDDWSILCRDTKIYLDIGGDMDDVKVPLLDIMDHMTSEHWWNPGYFWLDTALQSGVEEMRENLRKVGLEHRFVKYPGGRHNERAWAKRIDQPLRYLFDCAQD